MMHTKTKNIKSPVDKLAETAQRAGVLLLTAAVTFGMLELPDHSKRVIVPSQPLPESVDNENTNHNSNTLRREREETGPHYISYSVTQRTPGRAGKW